MAKRMWLLLLPMMLSGCGVASLTTKEAAKQQATQAAPGLARVVVEGDAFSKEVTILGAQKLDNKLFDFNKRHWYLRSYVDPKARKVSHELYAELTYTSERNGAYFAADNFAQPHAVVVFDRVGCGRHPLANICDREDSLGIDIPASMLRDNTAAGFAIKITARTGYSTILDVTPFMIALQLNAVQQVLSGAVVVGQTVESGGTIEVPTTLAPSATTGDVKTSTSGRPSK
jgi:hypothetical protein